LGNDILEGAWVEIVTDVLVVNPSTAGDYTLTVATSVDETEVESADYEIEIPEIGVLSGIVQQFNAADILMDQDTGPTAINDMVDSAGEGYTIVVGPGEYVITATIELDEEGLTLKSSAGADDTVIVAAAANDAIQITVDDVTVDGFTIEDTEDGYTAIKVTGADAIVQNNIMTDTTETGYPEGIRVTGSGATVSDNELDIYHTMMVIGATDCTLSDNEFGAGINLQGSDGITITDNTLVGVEFTGIVFEASVSSDILIEGNTISETADAEGTGIYFRPSIGTYDEIQIIGNDIIDNEGVGIGITTGNTLTNSVIKFNTITGNDADNDGYGIENASASDVDATFNWWGTDVADDVADMVSDDVTYEPFLTGVVEAVFSASEVAAGATSLDAKDTVGVRVSGATDATVISLAKYMANPQAAISGAIAFYDVYVVTATADVDVTIKFYAGDENSTLSVWSVDTEAWVDLSDDDSFGFSVYGGYIYIDYDADLLDGTDFAVVGGEAEEDVLAAPAIAAPTSGDDDVSLTPTFAWSAVPDADGYFFELADNANFVLPLVKLDGDTGRLIVTAYAYVGELPYSSAYYWRMKAVSGTV